MKTRSLTHFFRSVPDCLGLIRVSVVASGLFALLCVPIARSQTVGGVDYSDYADVDNTFDMSEADVFGQRFPSEHLVLTDEVTGVEVTALTTSRHDESTIYQTHPQWTPDGEYIVFRSDRTGRSRAYAISMEDKEIVQITTGDDVRELHLGWHENVLYYFRDGRLIKLALGSLLEDSEHAMVKDPDHYEEVIASLPEGIRPTGGAGLDANEQRMFIAGRVGEGRSAIYSIDFESGELTKLVEVPFWANHLQANRWVSGEVMYSWETGGDAPQRIWQLRVDEEGNVENHPVYKERPEEWVTHEVFMGPDHILFNVMGHLQRLQEQPTGIFIHNTRTNESQRLGQADGGGYWHAAGTRDLKWAVGDTFDGNLYRINLETGEATLLTGGHRPRSKSPFTREAHSHHSISPDGRWVLFNSSLLTESDIMLVPLQPLETSGERSSAARETPSREIPSRTLPSQAAILEDMRLANRYFMAKWPDVDQSMAVANKVWPSNIWTRAVYYEGLMALYEIDPQEEYYQYAVDWGEFHEWNQWGGVTTRNADNQAAGQTYIDLYQIDPQPERIENIKAAIDNMMATDKIDDWDWIDAIQMSMPVFAELGVIYDDPSYWERMDEMYMFTRNAHGDNGLYNPEDGLWWRDADYDPPHTSPAGEDVYWSRGNGWVLVALARVLDVLPEDAPHREQYVQDLRAMAEALVPIQREDGFWNVSLHDPTQFGGPETTGTAMFTYGMAWGINNGILDEETYQPVVAKAWNAMAEDALHPNGFLGYVQSTGKEPSTGQPVTYDKQPDFEDYGLGAFLLAGSEIYMLAGN